MSGGLGAMEQAADNREAAPWMAARRSSTSMLTSRRPKEVQHDTTSEADSRDGRSGEVKWRRSS
jgi:hypothetical protein